MVRQMSLTLYREVLKLGGMPEINLTKTMEKPSFWKLSVHSGGEIYTVFDEESDFKVENEQFKHQR